MRRAPALVCVALLLGSATHVAEGQAALLFGYRLHPGEEETFYEGYGRHLDWHRAQGDSLLWYGWQVVTGERIGLFVDGTFGQPFLAIDRRVDPAGDGADFAATAGPHADAVFRTAYTLRPDLGTGAPLERGRPTPLLEVVTYRVRPGTEHRFEDAVRRATALATERGDIPTVTWYELVDGGHHGTYLQVIHRQGFAGWDAARSDLASLLRTVADDGARRSLSATIAEVLSEVRSEVWRYLPGSSLVPDSFR